MYSFEELPYETRNEYYYGSQPVEYSDIIPYGCGNSIRSMRNLNYRGPPYSYTYMDHPDRSYCRRIPYYLGGMIEEDGSIPYDLNGTGTKIPLHLGQRDYIRNSPPSENMHTYYPSYIKHEMIYDDSFIPTELIPDFRNEEDELDRKRKYEEECDLDVPNGFKLPASKSPIMEAMAFCAIKRWGIEVIQCQDQTDENPARVIFKVIDFELYYKYSCSICSKQNPTEDLGSRVKSLRRWFVNFPKKRDRRENPQFSLEVKPEVAKKVYEMIEKYKCQINVKKEKELCRCI